MLVGVLSIGVIGRILLITIDAVGICQEDIVGAEMPLPKRTGHIIYIGFSARRFLLEKVRNPWVDTIVLSRTIVVF